MEANQNFLKILQREKSDVSATLSFFLSINTGAHHPLIDRSILVERRFFSGAVERPDPFPVGWPPSITWSVSLRARNGRWPALSARHRFHSQLPLPDSPSHLAPPANPWCVQSFPLLILGITFRQLHAWPPSRSDTWPWTCRREYTFVFSPRLLKPTTRYLPTPRRQTSRRIPPEIMFPPKNHALRQSCRDFSIAAALSGWIKRDLIWICAGIDL